MIIEPTPMLGGQVGLEPLTEAHRTELRQALDCDPANWEIQLASALSDRFDAYWSGLLQTERRIAFLVRDLASGAAAGTSSFLHLDPVHCTLEIGGTWLRPEFRGTAVNPEVKLLMLDRAFQAGAQRVQFTVDARNLRSQAAMLRLGATREGVIRRQFVTWTGHRRDSVLFSIIADEWPDIRAGLVERLEAARRG